MSPDPGDQSVVIPLMNEHQVRVPQRLVQVQPRQIVADTFQLRVSTIEVADRPLTVVGEQTLEAPGIPRLVDLHLVAARDQLGRYPAQEVRVAMIPIREQRVAEDYDTHAASASISTAAGRRS